MVDHAPLDIFLLAVYCTTFILGAPSSAVALCIFFRELKRKPTPNVIYMINLCISGGLFVASLPVKMVATVWGEWALPMVFCAIYHVFHFSTNYACVLFLTALSIGRYLSIAFPIRYKMNKSPRYSCVVCFVFWHLVIAHLAFIFLVEATGSQDHLSQLDLLLPLRQKLVFFFFLAPLVLTSFANLGCFWELNRSQLPRREKRKALWVASNTLTTLVACFAPYNTSHLVGFALRENVNWQREALLPSMASAFLNPLVFFCSSSALQRSTTQCQAVHQQHQAELAAHLAQCDPTGEGTERRSHANIGPSSMRNIVSRDRM
ncbi:free fatty acid receptor 3-like [Carcharodon carcharias]|uniref:free fatty acid receptor 3-like n=1 Tax=Carcharodon carcharias TaxID=13397 RepID=UPI001B7E1259|nr:free fatty acid receptor 3-like [Carcharodon carcharias]